MLTKLEVDGFKTFENLSVDFMPFTAVLGSNAAGKSNLFDVIQLLSQLATRDVAEAVKPMRGEPLELFRQTPSGQARQIRLVAEVLVDPVVRDPWGFAMKSPWNGAKSGQASNASRLPMKPYYPSCARMTNGPRPRSPHATSARPI